MKLQKKILILAELLFSLQLVKTIKNLKQWQIHHQE